MAEIKSTLDLVMEKTKNLNLSSEEINEQTDKEIQGKLNGLLQKYKDGFLVREKLERELATIQKKYGIKVENTFKKVILEGCSDILVGTPNMLCAQCFET